MNIISKQVEIKPNLTRSVHVHASGRANWVCPSNGKSINVRGRIVDNKFVPDPKYQHIVDAYVGKRNSYKGEAPIRVNPQAKAAYRKQLSDLNKSPTYVSYMGETRKFTWKSTNIGTVSYKGKNIPGRLVDGKFIPRETLMDQ